MTNNQSSKPKASPKVEKTKDVWPQKLTKYPKYMPKPIPAFNVFAYDMFFVTVIGILSLVTPLINWVFLAYGILVLVLKIDSQRLFSSALICLVIIPAATILSQDGIADTFAVMAFYFY